MTVSARSGGVSAAAEPAAAPDLARDRALCRALLPRVSRTFAINIRLLSGSFHDAVRTAYLLCRASDTLEDSWPGDPASIARRFDRFLDAVAGDAVAGEELSRDAGRASGDRADLETIVRLPAILRVYASLEPPDRTSIAEALQIMAAGMRKYATRASERAGDAPGPVAYLDDTEELLDYCHVVAGCVGVMLTRLFNRRAPADPSVEDRRVELAPRVGEALQLTNIFLDWPIDLRRGRCHVPARWIEEVGLEPGQLDDAHRPGVRELAGRLDDLARAAIARVPDYLDHIPARHLRYRLFCLWPAAWARASLDRARRDPEFPGGTHRPKLSRRELWRIAIVSTLNAGDGGAVRRRLAS